MDSIDRHREQLRAAIGGDRRALLSVLSRSRPELVEAVRRRIPAVVQALVDADDIVQDTHVEVFRHIHEFQVRDVDSFHRWVSTIAIRKVRDALRRQRAAKRSAGRNLRNAVARGGSDSMIALLDVLTGPEQTPSRVLVRREAVALMQGALAQLPEQDQRIIREIHIAGHPVEAIAAELGRTEGAVRVAAHKARRRLKGILGHASRLFSSRG